MRRYMLCPPGVPEETVNWLEQLETWSQRTHRKLEWDINKSGDMYTASVKIDGTPVPLVGTGSSPRNARVKLVMMIDKSEHAYLVGKQIVLAYDHNQ
ncbi:hypothetical protein RhiXN_01090 [Rhizoctonia solani]|uniref:Uncharacterized protein n=1 Tax=Rhizoctonia solani TaxID=456999 RepID=A0A8H8NTM5_9AGAM|nr:uncharacterized protein RhiXN_01090 [Rhizoctonia solani]QRW19684.1 hypothetical protein RhiXN_01090 [Rhizoctonia solani]